MIHFIETFKYISIRLYHYNILQVKKPHQTLYTLYLFFYVNLARL